METDVAGREKPPIRRLTGRKDCCQALPDDEVSGKFPGHTNFKERHWPTFGRASTRLDTWKMDD